MGKGNLYKPVIHILLIILFCVIAYSNTFQSPFHFDDKLNIVENPVIKKLPVFLEPSKAKDYVDETLYHGFKTRYIGYLSFALNYKIQGLKVSGYHIVNTATHIINALLVYWLVLLTFKTPFFSRIRKSTQPPFNSPLAKGGHRGVREGQRGILTALFSALLFALHPVQTQAVTYIVQRFTSLATMFYLLTLVMYIQWRFMSQNTEHRTCLPDRQACLPDRQAQSTDKKIVNLKSALWYLCSVFSAVLAMKTKEIAFTLPVIIILYEFMFFEGKGIRRILYLFPFLLTMFIIPLSLMGAGRPLGELISDVSEATRAMTTVSRLDYLFTEFRVITTYIRLIFIPVNQNLDYDYPLYSSFFNLGVFFSFIFLLSVLCAGVYCFYHSRITHHGLRLIAFGIFWFFITLSVESSVIPIVDVIFEHRLYLPSIGIFLAINTSLFIGAGEVKDRWKGIGSAVIGALVIIIFVLTGASYARNRVWKDEVSLWEDVVRKSPDKARAHEGLGFAYQSWGLIDRAIEEYRIAIKLDPSYQLAHGNLANAYQSQGFIDRAIEEWQVAIKLAPYVPEAYYNLGIIYQSQGNIDKAIEEYLIAVKLNPDLPQVHSNLGVAYKSQGLIDRAIEEYLIAIKLNPDILEAHYNLGIAYQSQGIFDKAVENYKEVLRLKPDWEAPHFQLGRIHLETGDIENARREFEKVLQINPGHYEAQKFLDSIMQRKNHL